MARTAIPVTALSRAGVAPPAATDSDTTNGMLFAGNDGRVFVEIVSTDASSRTVGFAVNATVDGQAVPDKTVTVPAGATRLAGPFPKRTYDQADGTVNVNPSVNTTLKLRAYRLPTA